MRKPYSKMIVTDEPAMDREILALAQSRAQRERLEKLSAWVGQRKVSIVPDDNPETITVQIEDQLFPCPRKQFPSIELIAQLGLALQAGLTDMNRRTTVDAMAYGPTFFDTAHLGDAHISQIDLEFWDGAHTVIDNNITAAVKGARYGK